MKCLKILFFMWLFCLPFVLSNNNLKSINGLLTDEVSGKYISFASVIVSKTGEGVLSNELGRFRMKVLPEDSLLIQVLNYESLKISIPDSLLDKGELYVIKLKPVSYEIKEVEVSGKKKTPTELKSDVFQEEPKFYVFFYRPISYIYYYTNRKERRKRELIKIKEQEELTSSFAHVYNRETIAEYSNLEGNDLDMCVMYCNTNIDLDYKDSDDDVRRKILINVSNYFNTKKDSIE